MSPLESAIAHAAVYETANSLLSVEKLILASMDSLREFTAKSQQMSRVDHLQRAVDTLAKGLLSPAEHLFDLDGSAES